MERSGSNNTSSILVTRCGGLLTEFKVLGSLDTQLLFRLALFAFHSQHNLTSSLGLFVKHWLRLSSESHLFAIVTTFALGKVTSLSGFVLCHFVYGMLFAFSSAVSFALLWDIDHGSNLY
jgi:hypothetical protein